MITNKASREYRLQQAPRQRLGDKEAYTSLVPNQNGNYVRYFSSLDAEIYFGDVFVDEVYAINYQVSQNAQPIYGYNSYIYDDIALGARIVNGTFSINFTKTEYMYEVIDTLNAISTSNSGIKRTKIDNRNPLWATPATLNNLKAGFDLYVSFGDARQSPAGYNSSVTVLKNVILTGCSTELDAKGQPILEHYSFIARDIDFLSNGTSNKNYNNDDDYKEQSDPITSLKYKEDDNKLTIYFKNNIYVGELIIKHKDVIQSYQAIRNTDDYTQMAQYTYEVKPELAKAIKQNKDAPINCILSYRENGEYQTTFQRDFYLT